MPSIPSETTDRTGEPFTSKLPEPRQRFLAHVVEHSLGCKRRTPADFLRHFPPAAIMHALRDQPELRAQILEVATGVRFKIAVKKSAEACGTDLQIALEEGETQAAIVVEQFQPDDRVRYLDPRALWRFLSEGSFWVVDPHKDRARHGLAAEHIAFIVNRGLVDGLITHRDVVEAITVTKLAELLPREELEMLLAAALKAGSDNKPFVERSLLTITPASTLVRHIPLDWVWEQAVVARIAEPHGLVPEGATIQPPIAAQAPSSEEDVDVVLSGDTHDAATSGLDLEVDEVLGTVETAAAANKPARLEIPRPLFKRT